MIKTKLPGERIHTQKITPDEVSKDGVTNSINRVTGPIRQELKDLLDAHGQSCNIYVAITVQPLTDSAGSPLMARMKGK